MLVYQKTMFDHFNCIKSFCHLKTLEKRFEKFTFCISIMARKSMKGFVGFEKAGSRAKTYVILMSLDYVNLCMLLLMTSNFVTA